MSVWERQPSHRMRRGKLVEIPVEWRGKVTDRQTIAKRPSKETRKLRNVEPRNAKQRMSNARARREALAPSASEWDA